MDQKPLIRSIALIVVFCAVAVVLFTENVRTVQIVGLLACGAVVGVSIANIVSTLKAKGKTE